MHFNSTLPFLALATMAAAQAPPPPDPASAVYTIRVPAPDLHVIEVEARLPTRKLGQIEVMMPVWTPGYYVVEDYAERVQELTAQTPEGDHLDVVPESLPNRWLVRTRSKETVTLKYRVLANQHSVTRSYVGTGFGVINPASALITLADMRERVQDVTLILPPGWKRAVSTLLPVMNATNRWVAVDYDELVDSPIVAGDLDIHPFMVDGTAFALVDVNQPATWDGARAARDLSLMVRANEKVFGDLPFKRYLFLNVFREGGGGLEHRSSTLLTVNGARATIDGYASWLAFASHEFVHAYNVKRLRPVELGPFDYEHPPKTTGLWIAEGVTTYLADLALARGGLLSQGQFLASISAEIADLQGEAGRLTQSLEQSSAEVWTNSRSGVDASPATVSYYVKGAVAGWLLDARIREATNGAKSLDDLMRAAYKKYGAKRGFTREQFRELASDVAQTDLTTWFAKVAASTDELDYAPALAWYGLRFIPPAAGAGATWALEVRDDATEAQRAHLAALLAP